MAKRKYAEGGQVSQGLRTRRANNNRGWEALDQSGRTEDEVARRVGELRPTTRRATVTAQDIENMQYMRGQAEDVGGRLRRGPISDTHPRVGWKKGGKVSVAASRPRRPATQRTSQSKLARKSK